MTISLLKKTLSHDSRLWLLMLCLIAFTMPGPVKLNNIFVISTIALWLVSLAFHKVSFKTFGNPLNMLLVVFFLIHVIGLLHTENLKTGFAYIERIHTIFSLMVILATVGVGPSSRKPVLIAFAISATIVPALYQIFPCEILDAIITTNRTYLGLYTLISLTIVAFYTFSAPNKPAILVLYLCWIILDVYLLITIGAKASIFLAPVIATAYLLFYIVKSRKILIPTLVALVCLGIFGVVLAFSPMAMGRIQRFIDDRSDYIRMRNWQTSTALIKDNFWAGVGTGDSLDQLQKNRETWWQEYLGEYNAHNQYLETTLRVGIFGTISFIAILIFPLARALKTYDFLLAAFVIIYLVSCLSESLLVRQKGVLLLSFFLCFFSATSSDMYLRQKDNSSEL